MLNFNNTCNYPYSKEDRLITKIHTRPIEEDVIIKYKTKVKSMLIKRAKN